MHNSSIMNTTSRGGSVWGPSPVKMLVLLRDHGKFCVDSKTREWDENQGPFFNVKYKISTQII